MTDSFGRTEDMSFKPCPESENATPSILDMARESAFGSMKVYSEVFGRHSWRCPVPDCEAGHVYPIRNGKGFYAPDRGIHEQDGDHVAWFRQGLVCPEHGAFIHATFSSSISGAPKLYTTLTEPSKSDLSGGSALSCDDIVDQKLKEELEKIDDASLDELDDCDDLDQLREWADEYCHPGGADGFEPHFAPNPFGKDSAIQMMALMAEEGIDLGKLNTPNADRGDVARLLKESIEEGLFGEAALEEWRDYVRRGAEESREEREPAGVSCDIVVTVVLAGGGPSIEFELIWNGGWAGGWYVYKDWFDGARRWISSDWAERVAEYYNIPSPEDMGYSKPE